MDTAIEVAGLVKRFGTFAALDGLDLSVARGRIHGFLGPNGAGKSTTLRVLLGLYRADGGRAEVLGHDPWDDAVALHERLAYVPGDVELWPRLTGGETIDLLLSMRGVRGRARRRDELIERFALDPTKRSSAYSKGNRQKVALVAALAADVDLLVMDEPTSGLDPLMEEQFRRCVREAAEFGTTVLLSSHLLGEVQALCDDVTIVRDGRTVLSGDLDRLRVVTRSKVSAELGRDAASLAERPDVHDLHREGDRTVMQVDDLDVPAVVAALAALDPVGLTVEPPSLEELFLRQYAGEG
ncbi:ABC transporter ATP-binding protein [Aeromicrobium sp. 179-A 4D2 NHS]|uniref:ABC transporter ATP-binding protein n=1 Tax=Aeromicrobium sp. 179-A 4D2 NHS TaxID=3142375 RepID=UPI0039A17928